MTAEFAVVLPAVLLVLLLATTAIGQLAREVQLQHLAGEAARMLERGESEASVAAEISRATDAAFAVSRDAGTVCVALSAPARLGRLALGITLGARSCALGP